ncbi:hypothetical protein [Enterococcus sp. DIV2163]|uniref:hypothetical protein n=1 Tax=Enterococcus sp. DIV2163 TaxID=2774834 RepID=UPI003D2FCA24
MKFQNKPVVVEAFQYDGDFMNSKGKYYVPDLAVKAYERGSLFYGTYRSGDKELPGAFFVKTLEGDMHVSVGNYLIRGVADEIYPCKPDIFYRTYEVYGKANMLRKIKVGAVTYDVTEKPFIDIDDNRNHAGCCDYDHTEIAILADLSAERKKASYLLS